MSSLFETLLGQLGGKNLGTLAEALGTDESTTRRALGNALPVLLGAISRNASEPGGANALVRALDRDHDGSILDDLAGFLTGALGQSKATDGAGILEHILGSKRSEVESRLANGSGVEKSLMAKLLPLLAPAVMAAIGRARKSDHLDADGLTDLLGGARSAVERSNPKAGGFLAAMLDQDGDGDVDFGDLRSGLIGKLFKR